MNREDVIRWMQEVGAKESNPTPQTYDGFVVLFQQFAKLAAEWGAKQEREACAAIAEMPKYLNETGILTVNPAKSAAAHFIAIAIRARGEVPK